MKFIEIEDRNKAVSFSSVVESSQLSFQLLLADEILCQISFEVGVKFIHPLNKHRLQVFPITIIPNPVAKVKAQESTSF